ncbi:MAG: hypothetical protein H6807_03980 [Planctomycetes bacterium]|nr:hypothetical protein [Planctomycetota bacterium]
MPNDYAKILGVTETSLAMAARRPDANYFGLLVAALIEKGGAMSLDEVAERLDAIGYAPRDLARRSLSRCRPTREPVFRRGELYDLDPHCQEAGLWAFRLGMCPPRARAEVAPPEPPPPLPDPERPIDAAALEEAWRIPGLSGWSDRRLVVCALEALGGRARPEIVIDFLAARGWSRPRYLGPDRVWNRGEPITTEADGAWLLVADHPDISGARRAVIKAIEADRRRRRGQPSPEQLAESRRQFEAERRAERERVATMRRALVVAHPRDEPEVMLILDVERETVMRFAGAALAEGRARLANFDFIAAVGVRSLLAALGFDWGKRFLGDIDLPQKVIGGGRGRKGLALDLDLLLRGSCGLRRKLDDREGLERLRAAGKESELLDRLEDDLRALFALHSYARLHGAVRVTKGRRDEMWDVAWSHWRDRRLLEELRLEARAQDRVIEAVLRPLGNLRDPWAEAVELQAIARGEGIFLFEVAGSFVFDEDVIMARLGRPLAAALEDRRRVEAERAEREVAASRAADQLAAAFEALRSPVNWPGIIDVFQVRLAEEPGDPRGLRHHLASLLLLEGRAAETRELLARFPEHDEPQWLYALALVEFLETAASDATLRAMRQALAKGPFFAAYLFRRVAEGKAAFATGPGRATLASTLLARAWAAHPEAVRLLRETPGSEA